MTERLLKAADAVKEDVCSLLCPSLWKTGERPPHHPKCVELRSAISEAIDDASYADLRAYGGLVRALSNHRRVVARKKRKGRSTR